MQATYDIIAAFAVGFMGSLHCIGMCGGISSALTSAVSPEKAQHSYQQLIYQLLFNLGRIFSYACAGGLVGFLGATLYQNLNPQGPSYLRIFAGVMMILLGLYISGWWKVLNFLEKAGAKVWKYISPITRKFVPIDNPSKALMLGWFWGWLPCGLVYSALTWSLGAGNATNGALLMVYFGLGTLPAMIAVGSFSHVLNDFARMNSTRVFAAMMLMAYGLWTISSQLMSHGGHHP